MLKNVKPAKTAESPIALDADSFMIVSCVRVFAIVESKALLASKEKDFIPLTTKLRELAIESSDFLKGSNFMF